MITEEQKEKLLIQAISIAQIRSDINALECEIANGGKDPGISLYKENLFFCEEQMESFLSDIFGLSWDIKSPRKLLGLPTEDHFSLPPFSKEEIYGKKPDCSSNG